MTMAQDVKRTRTFLSAKGFQWEPLLGKDEMSVRSRDFMACQEGVACFKGTVLSIGEEQHWDGAPIKVVSDPEEKDKFRTQLARQLGRSVTRLDEMADAGLPKVAIIANHEPCMEFEDLAMVLKGSSESGLEKIQMFIWFDDFRSDRMLISRSDTPLSRMMDVDT